MGTTGLPASRRPDHPVAEAFVQEIRRLWYLATEGTCAILENNYFGCRIFMPGEELRVPGAVDSAQAAEENRQALDPGHPDRVPLAGGVPVIGEVAEGSMGHLLVPAAMVTEPFRLPPLGLTLDGVEFVVSH